jgi:hypothetical protein
VFRDLLVVLFVALIAAQAAPGDPQPPAQNQSPANQSPSNQPPSNQSPSNQSPSNESPSGPQPQDPAAVVFTTTAGLVLHAVKAGSTADYEAAMLMLQEALAKDADPETQKVAAGWRIYKAAEPDAKASVIYVHLLDPAVAGVDYRPSLWLDKLLAGVPPDVLTKYRDAFAVPPTKLSLTELRKQP